MLQMQIQHLLAFGKMSFEDPCGVFMQSQVMGVMGFQDDDGDYDDSLIPDEGLEPGVLPTEIRKLVESRRLVRQMMKAPGVSPDQCVQVMTQMYKLFQSYIFFLMNDPFSHSSMGSSPAGVQCTINYHFPCVYVLCLPFQNVYFLITCHPAILFLVFLFLFSLPSGLARFKSNDLNQ